MRLLSSKRWEMKEFINDSEIPQYAILSHTWGEQEVTFENWQRLSRSEVKTRQGWKKIRSCRKQAVKDGYRWVWVDTCCIDKASSAELSEAINSMYRWYQNAQVCYIYLHDVKRTSDPTEVAERISKSRWFTRGWTLQELLAPRKAYFYSRNWKTLGTKDELVSVVEDATRINSKYLLGEDPRKASISCKMSWASRRNTSRSEDIAYCLLGLFDIHMPLLYGEGLKAFQRLQQTIMQTYPEDHTLFAWGTIVSEIPPRLLETEAAIQLKTIDWQPPSRRADQKFFGLLAASPRDFEESDRFLKSSLTTLFYHYSVNPASLPTNSGNGVVALDLPRTSPSRVIISYMDNPRVARLQDVELAALLCSYEGAMDTLTLLPLVRGAGHVNCRTREIIVGQRSLPPGILMGSKARYLVGVAPSGPLLPNDIILRRRLASAEFGHVWPNVYLGKDTFANDEDNILRPSRFSLKRLFWLEFWPMGLSRAGVQFGFGVAFRREMCNDSLIHVEIVPISTITDPTNPPVYAYNMRWFSRNAIQAAEALLVKTMATPDDQWLVDQAPFPRMHVRVERLPLEGEEDSYVDVVDVLVWKREDAEENDELSSVSASSWETISSSGESSLQEEHDGGVPLHNPEPMECALRAKD